MQNIDAILKLLLAAYYLICAVYLVFALINNKKRKFLIYWFIMLALPIVGIPIVVVFTSFTRNRSAEVGYYEKFEKTEYESPIRDKQAELNATSVVDVLMINGVEEKRNVVFDIFRSDATKYVKELKIALGDEDTEVAHYASSALTEIKRNFDNKLIERGEAYRKNSADERAVDRYAEIILRYINSGIMDKSSLKKYKALYCEIREEYYCAEVQHKMTDYRYYLSFLCDENKSVKAVNSVKKMLEIYDDKSVYFAALELYYTLNMHSEFYSVIARIKNSSVILSKEEVNTLRFFEEKAEEKG